MKDKLISLILDVLIAALVLGGLIDPLSVAVNFVAAWALLVSFASIVVSLTGIAVYKHWENARLTERPINDNIMKTFRALFCKTPSKGRRAWSLIMLAFTFSCLVGAGWIFTALIYLICLCSFKMVRITCRQCIEGAGLCPESL